MITLPQTLRVFISYSHDSEAHCAFVLQLAQQMRADGLDCQLDQCINGSPPEGWQRWMENEIEQADFVLVVCTPTYLQRYRGQTEDSRHRAIEGLVISRSLYEAFYCNTKFIPVLSDAGDFDDVPLPLKAFSVYRLMEEYEDLFRLLTRQPKPIGIPSVFPKSVHCKRIVEGPRYAEERARSTSIDTNLFSINLFEKFKNISLWFYKRSKSLDVTMFAPQDIKPKKAFAISVCLHKESDLKEVLYKMQYLFSLKRIGYSTGNPIEPNTELSIKLKLPDFNIHDDDIKNIIWRDKPINLEFLVSSKIENTVDPFAGTLTVTSYGILIADVKFLINFSNLDNKSFRYRKNSISIKGNFSPRSAFASYSSEDRAEVFKRIQGIKSIVPDIDIYIDVLKLRAGEQWEEQLLLHIAEKDIFYLFWSELAMKSKYVEKEWRLALEKRGISYISPIPLENPSKAPPPKELASLHFSDTFLAYIDYYQEHMN
ncbi:toll/interleukin-1 receptor domain-containing protein [Thiolinea disciformis]|uniref:toll/interleukin-1 receptor domain-containing protein n=1 Tax=Thiolinea disciformis TaxID=125614 RepID=UPI00036F5BB7|nr:toll/interleukin-1 receptor domain-containing protein [Thiolinea disciformis]